MKKIERRAQIEYLATRNDYIAIADLATRLGVSESTVRRDVDEMEKEGLLFRNQGLIVWNHPDQSHMEKVYYRSTQNVAVKQKLALRAATLLENNDVVFIDTGTTMYQLANAIPGDLALTVVTNDLTIALELETRTNVNTVVLGGTVRHGTHSLVGGFAERNLDGLRFNKMFAACGGISLDDGFMYFNLAATELRRKIVHLANEVIVVADSTKFGATGFVTGITFDECDALVTDSIPRDYARRLQKSVEVMMPEA